MNRNDWQAMALRTRLFARLQKLVERDLGDVSDMAVRREGRGRLQSSAVGRWLFGGVHPRVVTEEFQVDGRSAVVHRPADVEGPLPIVVNFHGGGWATGHPEQSRWVASGVAARAGAIVVSPVYRLAPEHPFPAAVDDAWSTLQWVVDHAADLGGDAERIAVMGDSAGGNLAAVTALRARDENGPKLRGQVLIYPAVEMYEKFPSELRMPNAPVLTSASMSAYAHMYLGEQYGTESHLASPLRAESHADLAPAFILTAQFDPLLDNGVRYFEALTRAGTPARYAEYAGAVHGFMSLPGVVPAAHNGLNDIVDFLRNHF